MAGLIIILENEFGKGRGQVSTPTTVIAPSLRYHTSRYSLQINDLFRIYFSDENF